MTDPIRESAIEAAATRLYDEHGFDDAFAYADERDREEYRGGVAPLVDAVLAVARPAYRAEGRGEVVDYTKRAWGGPIGLYLEDHFGTHEYRAEEDA